MNVFLLTDLEGIPQIFSIDEIDRLSENYIIAREKLTAHINHAAEICKQNGAENIYFLDGHAGGGNVIDERTAPFAKKITVAEWEALLKEGGIDCAVELGSHARAGTLFGFLDHTTNSKRVFSLEINGIEQSELSIHALFNGVFGVPTVMCSGDEAACLQAKEYIPDIVTAPVKKALCRNECEGFENCGEIFEKALAKALAEYKNIKLYELCKAESFRVRMTFYRSDMCEENMAKAKFPCERIDARTLERTIGAKELFSYHQLVF